MKKAELRGWIAVLGTIFVVLVVFNVLKQEGGIRYYFYTLDWIEVLGTIFVAAIGTILVVWHGSVLLGILFVIATLIALSRTGRLRGHMRSLGLFAAVIAIPSLLLWHITRHHLPLIGGFSLWLFWAIAPVLLIVCIRHAIIRRREPWTTWNRRVAYLAASLTFLMASLSMGTFKSDAEVERSLDRGRDLAYAIKAYHARNSRLPDNLEDLVPAYFPSVPRTDVPEGWSGREDYVYQRKGEAGFTIRFESASYVECNYDRAEDSWDCR